ncbi:MAG: acyl-CoA thioesterase [Proteobacteria bacterium]|nr:acyl-CoA thioesterase [Pseudomonadota bacterium]
MSATALTQDVLIRYPHVLRWRDLDAFEHVNNSTFLTYLEETRLQWFGRIDGEWMGEHFMPVVAAVHVNYRAQLGWPGEVVVELTCERLGNSSLTLAHRIVDATDESKLYSDGNVVMVWVDPANGTPVALPEAIRRACTK